jgi:hypothetical protein
MSVSNLSVRDQNRFITSVENLVSSERVHNKDLKNLSKTLDKLDKIKNSHETLISLSTNKALAGKLDIYNPTQVKSVFTAALEKLGKQGSNMFESKHEKLTNISERLLVQSEKIHTARVDKNMANVQNLQTYIGQAEGKIADLDSKKNAIFNDRDTALNKLESISPGDIKQDKDSRISMLRSEAQKALAKVDNDLKNSKNLEIEVSRFARQKGHSKIDNDLRTAKKDPSFKLHMATETYAKNHFGTQEIEGRREWSAKVKVLHPNGVAFRSKMTAFNNMEKTISSLKNEKTSIEKNLAKNIAAIQSEKISPLQTTAEKAVKQMEVKFVNTWNKQEETAKYISTQQIDIDTLVHDSNAIGANIPWVNGAAYATLNNMIDERHNTFAKIDEHTANRAAKLSAKSTEFNFAHDGDSESEI